MRSTIIACVVLLVTVAFALSSPWITNKILGDVEDAANAISEDEGAESAARTLYETLERDRLVLSLFLTDNTMRDIRGYALDILTAVNAGNFDELKIAKSRLIGLISQQKRLLSFDIEAIL